MEFTIVSMLFYDHNLFTVMKLEIAIIDHNCIKKMVVVNSGHVLVTAHVVWWFRRIHSGAKYAFVVHGSLFIKEQKHRNYERVVAFYHLN